MSIITLTTDFGHKDHFVGALKGKILTENTEAQIIDISHDIDLFNIAEASYVIHAAFKSFPKGTIHIIGVDSERTITTSHVAMQWNDHYFICADNGILSILTEGNKPQKLVELNSLKELSNNSSSLDSFVVAANRLAKGSSLNELGTEILALKSISTLKAVVSSESSSIKGYIVYIDHFGNCVSNISKQLFEEIGQNRSFEIQYEKNRVKVNRKPIRKIHNSYSDFVVNESFSLKEYEGEKLALFNESGFLEIAIYKSNPNTVGSAKSLLGLNYYDEINIVFF